MKKILLALSALLMTINIAVANENCFIAKVNGKIMESEGDCTTRHAPQSTFKIPLSLIGFDSGILVDEENPSWDMPKGTVPYGNVQRGYHGPRTWIRDSCVWYSQLMTEKLGMEEFQRYVDAFDFGNRDLSGGLKHAWVSSSLKISPTEQADFLQKVIDRKLPISANAYDMTKKVTFVREMWGGWNLYAKSGGGDLQGWYIGYIEKGGRTAVFASHIVDKKKQTTSASLRAQAKAVTRLYYIIDELER